MNVYEQQRDILFEACKKVATDQKCPKWIADLLRDAVMKAKQTKEEFPTLDNSSESPTAALPLQIGDIVVITNNNACCIAKIIAEPPFPGDIRIFDVQVTENTKNHNIGQVFHNVPETFMRRK